MLFVTVNRAARWSGLVLCACAVAATAFARERPSRDRAAVDFNRDIRPILSRNCLLCHGPDISTREAGLRLDLRERAVAATESGRGSAIVPGDSAASLLIRRVTSNDESFRMPPADRRQLRAEDVELLRRWIDQGAVYRQHWSWASIHVVAPAKVNDPGWPAGTIDRFILAALEAGGLRPAPPADKRTLVRRLSFDLIGLPPNAEEVEAFAADDSPDAYARLVDRLLASQHFGERWGRHWLDLVRYAETYGHEYDYPIRHAWRYRDYVIRALNADLPYDRFVTEHIAGDLLPEPRRHPSEGYNESLIATGFWFLSQGTHAPVDVRGDEAERIDNQIDVLSKTFMGVTVSCARCHDHKFDAITTKDYYALAGFLQSSRRQDAYLDPRGKIADAVEQLEVMSAKADELLAEAVSDWQAGGLPRIGTYLIAAHSVRFGPPKSTDPPIAADVLFEDFESLTYRGWQVEGEAFSDGPHTQATMPKQQGNVAARGDGFVNSHSIRGSKKGDDKLTGQMTSEPFVVQRRYVHFLIGGGRHKDRTGVQLLVSGEVVRSATGHNHNKMRAARFDVGDLRGESAQLRIIDDEKGGWGNIGVDHIVFSDHRDPVQPDRRPVDIVAQELSVDRALLQRWLDAMRDSNLQDVDHPLHRWAPSPKETGVPTASKNSVNASAVFADFLGDDFGDWFISGQAFGDRPSRSGDRNAAAQRTQLVRPALAHSGLLAGRLQGTLRSRTFELERKFVHYRARGRGGRIRLIVDGYTLDEFNALLFNGFTFDVNADAPAWQYHTLDVTRFLGHRAHIELIDDGDGYLAVDEIRFSDRANNPFEKREPRSARRSISDLADACQERFESGVAAWREGSLDADRTELTDWLFKHKLIDLASADGWLQFVAADEEARSFAAGIAKPMRALTMTDGTGEDEYVFVRGSHKQAGPVVPRRFIESIGGSRQPAIRNGSGRLELARRLLDSSNPLPARVMVNRIWLHLFGVGLVSTPDNFGALGQMPTHPQLLDYLADRFRGQATWSIKTLIREIVLSSTYRMAGAGFDPLGPQRDPTNRLLWRSRTRRLEGEAIRDAVLAISGRLDRAMFGESVPIHLTRFMTGRGRPGKSGPLDGDGRRSIYIAVRRNFLSPMMLAFDTPIPASTIGKRNNSNVPAQALIMMNDPFVIEQARVWARRVLAGDESSVERRIAEMFVSAYARPPSQDELSSAVGFLKAQAAEYGSRDWRQDEDVWTDLCHVLFNAKEFVFLN